MQSARPMLPELTAAGADGQLELPEPCAPLLHLTIILAVCKCQHPDMLALVQAAFPSLKLTTGEASTDRKPLFQNSKVGIAQVRNQARK